MESPLLRPTGGLLKSSRCRSPIDADFRQPKRRRQPTGPQPGGIINIPPSPSLNQFSLIPSQEHCFYGGTVSHPMFAPSLHGFGSGLNGAAFPAWGYFEQDQPYQSEPLFNLVINNHNMGGGDVPPALAEYPLEMPGALVAHQPLTSTQYVNSDKSWEQEPGYKAVCALHQSPLVEQVHIGLAQCQPLWQTVTSPFSHNGEGFHDPFSGTFQSRSTSTQSLPPPSTTVVHPISRALTEFQSGKPESGHSLSLQPVCVVSPFHNVSNMHHSPEPVFRAGRLSNVDEGTLEDNPTALPETRTLNMSSSYVSVTKNDDNHSLVASQPSDFQDIHEHGAVHVETPLVGDYVDLTVKEEPVADVTQRLVAAVSNEIVVKDELKAQGYEKSREHDLLRKQTSETRSMRACIRCHNQRVRCRPNMDNPNDPLAPCVTCLSVRRDSKKTIHNLPCFRYRLASIVLNRDGGLSYTTRFTHTQLVDIRGNDWMDKNYKIIEMAQGLCDVPMRLKVRAFRAKEGDKVNRHLVSQEVVRIPTYGLVDVRDVGKAFQKYILANAIPALEQSTKNSDVLVQQVYGMIASHLQFRASRANNVWKQEIKQDKERSSDQGKQISAEEQRDFLLKTVRLWFAIRHQTGSAWICGEETLGMESADLKARYIPRMIVAQFDSIRYHTVFKNQVPQFLRMYDKVLTSWREVQGAWFTAFMVTFLLLHNVACICKDRRRHALENSQHPKMETRYGAANNSLTQFVEDVQRGAAVMLAYWTYFKRCDLMNFDWDSESVSKSALQQLEPDQLAFLKQVVNYLKTRMISIPSTPEEGCWEHELYWVSLMFVSEPSMTSSWKPPIIFSLAKPSVGNT